MYDEFSHKTLETCLEGNFYLFSITFCLTLRSCNHVFIISEMVTMLHPSLYDFRLQTLMSSRRSKEQLTITLEISSLSNIQTLLP